MYVPNTSPSEGQTESIFLIYTFHVIIYHSNAQDGAQVGFFGIFNIHKEYLIGNGETLFIFKYNTIRNRCLKKKKRELNIFDSDQVTHIFRNRPNSDQFIKPYILISARVRFFNCVHYLCSFDKII